MRSDTRLEHLETSDMILTNELARITLELRSTKKRINNHQLPKLKIVLLFCIIFSACVMYAYLNMRLTVVSELMQLMPLLIDSIPSEEI